MEWVEIKVRSMKGMLYKMVVRHVMMYGLETVALTNRQGAEVNMLRFSLGVTRKDKIKSEDTSVHLMSLPYRKSGKQ